MLPKEIILEPEDRRWREMKAKENPTSIAALICQAFKQMCQEEYQAKSTSFEVLLKPTWGIALPHNRLGLLGSCWRIR